MSTSRTIGRVAWHLGTLAFAVGCGAARSGSPVSARPAHPVIETTPVIVTEARAESVAEVFERAFLWLEDGRPAEAAILFDAVVAADTSGRYSPTAAFNAGLAWQRAGDVGAASIRFEDAIGRSPQDEVGKQAAIQLTRLCARAEDWPRLSRAADFLLARPDLTELERVEALGAKALALVASGDIALAEGRVSEALSLIEVLRLGEGGRLPTSVAQVRFAQGEVRRLKSEQSVFVPLPPNFADVLELRCQGLLDAQSAYTEAMRSFDPHWAAMSGYRVGQLYQRLYADVLAIAPPPQADTPEKRALFEGAMRLRFRVLLEKGLKMMDHTIRLGERTGQAATWIERARTARDELVSALAQQKDALGRLPYSEADLQRALDALDRKAPSSS